MKIKYFVSILIAISSLAGCTKTNTDISPDTHVIPLPNPSTSLGTVLTDFSPRTAYIGDTLILKGKNLGTDLGFVHIKFGEVESKILSLSDSVARVEVPQGIEQGSKITFISHAFQSSYVANFNLKTPLIESLSVTSGFEGQQITAYGKGFSSTGQFVYFGEERADRIESPNPRTEFRLEVPLHVKAGSYPVSVAVDGIKAISPITFKVLVPSITSISTHAGSSGIIMNIKGENLKDINGSATNVYFNYNSQTMGFPVSCTLVTDKELELNMPANKPGDYDVNVWIVKSRSNFIKFTVPK